MYIYIRFKPPPSALVRSTNNQVTFALHSPAGRIYTSNAGAASASFWAFVLKTPRNLQIKKNTTSSRLQSINNKKTWTRNLTTSPSYPHWNLVSPTALATFVVPADFLTARSEWLKFQISLVEEIPKLSSWKMEHLRIFADWFHICVTF